MPEDSNVVAWKTERLWHMATGGQKANTWHGRGKCYGLWPPAFARSSDPCYVS